MKKRTLYTAVGATAMSAMMLAAAPVQGALLFSNIDGAGVPGAFPGGFISVDKLSTNVLSNGGNYTTFVNLGVAGGLHTLDQGDTFSETLSLTSVSSIPASLALSGDYRLDVSLTGIISSPVTGGTITVNPDGTVSNTGGVFDVAFSTGAISLFNDRTNTKITDLTLVSGGGSGIQLVAGQPISDVTLNALIGPCVSQAICDQYLRQVDGSSVFDANILSITTGSTRFGQDAAGNPLPNGGFAGTVYGGDAGSTLAVNFFDNGEATTFNGVPEPGSLLLAGIGLLGAAAMRRKKNT